MPIPLLAPVTTAVPSLIHESIAGFTRVRLAARERAQKPVYRRVCRARDYHKKPMSEAKFGISEIFT
jgi:hypothetical protein